MHLVHAAAHSYQYTFAPNPHWSSLYAPGKEIQAYLQATAEKFGATRFIKTSHKLESAVWDAATQEWTLQVTNLQTGETFEERCNILITARGQLSNINWPDIAGLDTFKGKIMHSAAWDTDYDFTNKRVAVIGNGSSSIQIVPSLQKVEGTDLKVFMRSRTWISSRFGDNAMVQLGLDPNDVDCTFFCVLRGVPVYQCISGKMTDQSNRPLLSPPRETGRVGQRRRRLLQAAQGL